MKQITSTLPAFTLTNTKKALIQAKYATLSARVSRLREVAKYLETHTDNGMEYRFEELDSVEATLDREVLVLEKLTCETEEGIHRVLDQVAAYVWDKVPVEVAAVLFIESAKGTVMGIEDRSVSLPLMVITEAIQAGTYNWPQSPLSKTVVKRSIKNTAKMLNIQLL